MIDAGISLDLRTRDGETALHYAARFKRSKMATLLLRAGCDINSLNCQHQTPLHVAIANKAWSVAKILVKVS